MQLGADGVFVGAGIFKSEVTLNHEFYVDEEAETCRSWSTAVDERSRCELEAMRLSCERLALLLRKHSMISPTRTNAKEA